VKFVLFVEGYTEKQEIPAFLKRYLDPRLSQLVGIKSVGVSVPGSNDYTGATRKPNRY